MFNFGNILSYNSFSPVTAGCINPFLFQSFSSSPINYAAASMVVSMYQSRIAAILSASLFTGSSSAVSGGAKVDTFVSTTGSSAQREKMVSKAKSYVGVVNSSAEGNRLFSPANYRNTPWYRKHGSWGWCCDFAVSCAKDTLGSRYPSDMITSSPDGLKNRAKDNHGAYMEVPTTNKNSWLVSNVKPGDIIYMKGKGVSGKHIAVVESVDSSGNIKAVSGNSGGKVQAVTYNVNTSGIYGFISLDKIAA